MERTNWKKRCNSSSWSDHHYINRRPPGNYRFNKRRVPSSVSSGPSSRKMARENPVPARLKQPMKEQANPDYLVPVHPEDQ
ncbi:hypothetical protein TNIN_471861 [Trichonephila inaurata madagascariensis]|uniref:Uncharacterized protein n=1 Tax=Trichonephila inaurata madagascariensis TaxID=2747483 RepID=A0A8X6IDN6_9ARAC|nr:hypothetical protein TNIN_471861 [Trichonephila inaurata madagascariensis]